MRTKEYLLYIKTMAYSTVIALVIFIPIFFIISFIFGLIYDPEMLMTEIDWDNAMRINYYFISSLFFATVLFSFPFNSIVGNFFYKSLTINSLNKEKVTNIYIQINLILMLILISLTPLLDDFWWPDIVISVVSTMLFVKIFRNVVNNNGKINYKKIWQI